MIKTTGMLTAAAVSLTGHRRLWAMERTMSDWLAQQYYDGIKGLAEYPYFELSENGLLRLTVDGLDGGIDGHTHFALNAFAGGNPDLLKVFPKTRYYLPPDIKTSLYLYANQSPDAEEKQETGRQVMKTLLPGGSPVAETHTIPNLLAEMDLLGIEKAVVFPVKCGLPFGDDMTERYIEAIDRSGKADRFIVCGSVKPTAEKAVEEVTAYQKMGLKGIKMHPNLARFYPDDQSAWPVYEKCGELDLPVLIHCGRTGFVERKTLGVKLYTEDFSDIARFEAPIAAFPNTRFVLCHSGALQNEDAVRIAGKHQNVWLDIHGQGVGRIKAMIKEVGAERLMFGSDWGFYPEAAILVRLLIATEQDPVVRRMIFSENARRFWGIT